MNQSDLIKLGIALGIAYAVYKFAPGGPVVKTAAVGVMGTMVAMQIPYVKEALGG